MSDVLKKLQQLGIIPVVKIDDASQAAPLAKALCEGGLPTAEVTFRTEAASEAIKNMLQECPEMFIGAGTVLTTEQVDSAIEAGCKFIVSPGYNPKIVEYCKSKQIPIVPGISTPSEIESAMEAGLEAVKFFPAEASGGLKKIVAMAAPYRNMKFMPTGGINDKNIGEYLDCPQIIACGGSWMVKDSLIQEGRFDEIKKLTQDAVKIMLGFQLRHVGINANSNDEAGAIATAFDHMFGFSAKEGNSSYFAGTGIEVMKQPYLGVHGHIAIQTNNIERAIYHMELKGYEFDQETAKFKNGKMVAIYFKGEQGGFAVHLVQKG